MSKSLHKIWYSSKSDQVSALCMRLIRMDVLSAWKLNILWILRTMLSQYSFTRVFNKLPRGTYSLWAQHSIKHHVGGRTQVTKGTSDLQDTFFERVKYLQENINWPPYPSVKTPIAKYKRLIWIWPPEHNKFLLSKFHLPLFTRRSPLTSSRRRCLSSRSVSSFCCKLRAFISSMACFFSRSLSWTFGKIGHDTTFRNVGC